MSHSSRAPRRDQLLGGVGAAADNDQAAQPVFFLTDGEVHTIGAEVDEVAAR
jgi:hypothetical protein